MPQLPFNKATFPINDDLGHLSQSQLIELMHEYAHSVKVQKSLFEIADAVYLDSDIETFYRRIHNSLSSLIYAENIIIATLDQRSETINFVYFKDTVDTIKHDELRSLDTERIKNTLTGYVLRTEKPLLANRKTIDELIAQGFVCQVGQSSYSWMGVPLMIEQEVSGVIAIQSYNADTQYNQDDLELLICVASHISTVIQRKQMSEEILTVNKALRESQHKLEEKVQRRTNELVKSNYELHKLLRERDKTQAKLYHDALHDKLTGLPNRTLFIDRLLKAMSRAKSRENLQYAVLFIDLDRFKLINDSLGHLTGDLLLKEVSTRLAKAIRPCDSVARFGGDEFCILLEGKIDEEETIMIAERVISLISEPYILQGYKVFTSPSVGIAACQSYYENPEDILRDADAAMYQAKQQGKARYEFFDVSMHHNALKRLQLETDLRVAIKANELDVHFQPIVNLDSQKLVGFEALVRWHHHQLGFISPLDFIGIAEETGLIVELGQQILEQALGYIELIRKLNNETKHYYVSVNLSPKQLENNNLVKDILNSLKRLKLPTSSLKLEITESILINSFSAAKETLNEFDANGIDIMLDDFGTGFSSLSYLHHFPIKVVKIDRSFVSNMFEHAKDLAVIKSVESLSTSLNMDIVAEGIETDEQFIKLKELGVTYGQGYLIAKPMPKDDIINLLNSSSGQQR